MSQAVEQSKNRKRISELQQKVKSKSLFEVTQRVEETRPTGTGSLPSLTMTVTGEEAENALALKAKVLAAEDVDDLTDFEIAQFALVSKTDHERAMKRVRRLQALRRRYSIGSTMEHVKASFAFIEQNSPGLFLGMSTTKDGCTALFNESQLFQRNGKIPVDDENIAAMMSFMVHLLEAVSPDITAVRNGLVSVSLCEGVGWGNFNMEMERRGAEVYQDSYPIRMKGLYMLDPPFIINAIMDIVKVSTSATRSGQTATSDKGAKRF